MRRPLFSVARSGIAIVSRLFFSLRRVLAALPVLLSVVLLAVGTVSAADDREQLRNQLADHPAPYLALHGQDPVLWQDWNDNTVELAQEGDKLLFLSVGYFSCHWCHVMQRESYQNDDVADVINKNFIPVKIDRELHPALDARLMDFAVQLHGRGGWPLNVFLTPEGHPLAAVFYRPQENFLEILTKLDSAWQENREQLRNLARTEANLPANSVAQQSVGKKETAEIERLVQVLSTVLTEISDPLSGGFGNSSKFPQTPQVEFLLQQQQLAPTPERAEFLQTTLHSMATRGLRDHIGGGFFRYTVDPAWDVPHFEKMLYGNAQLARVYLRAGQVFSESRWTDVATDTLDFMIKDMQTESGAMVAAFSAIDADDVEGGYYLWSRQQLTELLEQSELAVAEISMTLAEPPPLPDGHLPHRQVAIEDVARQANLSVAEAEVLLQQSIQKLRDARASRELPTDTKLLAGWNGLALSTLAEAAGAMDEPRYREAAHQIRDFLLNRLWRDSELWRAEVDGKAIGAASVEDYAYVGHGLIMWANLTGLEQDWAMALEVLRQGWQRFNRDNGWYRAEQTLIGLESPSPALVDGSMPSPSAVMVEATALLLASKHATAQSQSESIKSLRQRVELALNVDSKFLESNIYQFASYLSQLTPSP